MVKEKYGGRRGALSLVVEAALREAVESSFNMMDVDSDSSTNDTVVVMANGLAWGGPIDRAHPEVRRRSGGCRVEVRNHGDSTRPRRTSWRVRRHCPAAAAETSARYGARSPARTATSSASGSPAVRRKTLA